jgi:nucleotide-binding universal stress UspA family protein
MMTMKHILVPTDFGEPAGAALIYGRELAGRFGATLYVLHVTEDMFVTRFGSEMFASVELQRDFEASARLRLDELIRDGDGSGLRTKTMVITSASPAFAIIDYAKENGIDLIVMGTHGRGVLGHLLMGSVAERVVRLAPCPVLTMRHPEHEFVGPDVPVSLEHVLA